MLCHEASPKSFADSVEFEAIYKPLLEKTGIQVERCDGFSMRRGDYVIAHALGEDLQMQGTFVDVFSPDLEVCEDVVVSAGTGGLFKCFDPAAAPSVIHSTCGLMEQGFEDGTLCFSIRGPQETAFTVRVSLGEYSFSEFRSPDENILIYEEGGTLKITGRNSPEGVSVEIALNLKEELCRV